jgi:hypothetical protein
MQALSQLSYGPVPIRCSAQGGPKRTAAHPDGRGEYQKIPGTHALYPAAFYTLGRAPLNGAIQARQHPLLADERGRGIDGR